MAKKPAKRKALDLTLPIYQIKISLKDTEPLDLAAGADERLSVERTPRHYPDCNGLGGTPYACL